MNLIKLFLTLVLLFSFQSCTKDVDFDQINDTNIETTYLTTFVHFNLTARSFLDNLNDEIQSVTDIVYVNIVENSQKYLTKVEFTMVIDNSFDREFTVEMVFYDATDTNIYNVEPVINVPANSSETTTILEIPESEINVVYNINTIKFLVTLIPPTNGNEILDSDISNLKLESYMTLYYNYR